ncbi:ubiquinone biosynthesis monooxygenase Coq7 [Coemansia sp. RSA 989]|nr:ubiquinone biosynthesis monooxygenase Coq7 [Coemansia sp. RSA 1086]KAJ1752264.1 ubiquinone biosynthesis monooxygenase Coq7 [Coemansia sp. RSA 1821]KAJ1866720.1 ubiquinone biosynthesis monooxygenase Coq7 [Coemansia sp. RSA 989]KAJ1873580.1 ubiquinone biosynthesis monooxygenase Coq7 [Coemansia sp. RSA 990]KAJ2629392.1 ubiquinone biosynthesis monooxygenase Coq7 [Coemansia sp. RSA 1290]KAJ2648765.1 ubiquinone biosynthesis monooxygenase Coq7 [Coemansia sp. RSA 1250]KAJ2671039.1 ubiquinone biosy
MALLLRTAATQRNTWIRSISGYAARNPYLKDFKYKDKVDVLDGKLTLSSKEHAMIDQFIRVNQAGETAAVTIYKGQMAVLGGKADLRELLVHMRDQEVEHLRIMDQHVRDFKVRPTLLLPVAAAGGYVLGMVSALLGVKSAMTCTEAVETRIGLHYNDQLRDLHVLKYAELDQLKQSIAKCRDEELEHLDTAVDHGARLAPLYQLQFEFIKNGCGVAIWLCERI